MPPRFSIVAALAGPAGANFFRGFATERLAKGQILCTGEGGRNVVFIVMRGRLRVHLIEDEKELTLFYLSAWDLFCTHSGCFVTASEATELRVAPVSLFEKRMTECPEVSFALVSVLGRAMTRCLTTIRDLMFHAAAERVVNFFIDYAITEGRQTPRGIELRIALSVEEIAQIVGLSRQRASSALNMLLKSGLLLREARGQYLIPDLDVMRAARFRSPKAEHGCHEPQPT